MHNPRALPASMQSMASCSQMGSISVICCFQCSFLYHTSSYCELWAYGITTKFSEAICSGGFKAGS